MILIVANVDDDNDLAHFWFRHALRARAVS